MASNPNDLIETAIGALGVPSGFVEEEKYRFVNHSSASRSYFFDRQSITISLKKTDNAAANFNDFTSSLKQIEHSSTHSWLSRLSCGDAAILYRSGRRTLVAIAVATNWRARVDWDRLSAATDDEAQRQIKKIIGALCQVLPPTPELRNPLHGDDASHCRWLMPLKLCTSISELSGADLEAIVEQMRISQGDLSGLIFNPTHASFLQQHRYAIVQAAQETNLAPEIIASAVLSEVRGLDQYLLSTKFVSDLVRYIVSCIRNGLPFEPIQVPVDYWGYGFANAWDNFVDSFIVKVQKDIGINEQLKDLIASYMSDTVSVGLVQRQVDSLVDLQVHRRIPELANLSSNTEPDLRTQLRNWLLDEQKSIRLGAHYIRALADQAAIYAGTRSNELKRWMEKRACGTFDLAIFAEHGERWTPLHVNFLGWKYNTGHLRNLDEIKGIGVWGDMFLLSLKDIAASGIFKDR